MKAYRFYWRKISKIFLALLFSGCSTTITPPLVTEFSNKESRAEESFSNLSWSNKLDLKHGIVEKHKNDDAFGADFPKKYCSGNRQIRELSLNLTLIEPKPPIGWPIDEASEYLQKISKDKICQLKLLFFQMAKNSNDINTNNPLTEEENRKLWFLQSQYGKDRIEGMAKALRPIDREKDIRSILVASEEGKLIFFDFFEDENSNFVEVDSNLILGNAVHSSYLGEIKSLIEKYTILEPLDFQEKAYSVNADNCDLNAIYGDAPRGEKMSIGAALEQRENIWQRYFARFTMIKKSDSINDPQLKQVQLSVDLNPFCRYGRSISDLTSK